MMKKLFLTMLLFGLFFLYIPAIFADTTWIISKSSSGSSKSSSGRVDVRAYQRKDGTNVKAHTRSSPKGKGSQNYNSSSQPVQDTQQNTSAEEKKDAPKAPTTPKEEYYTVQKGDTLWSISEKFLNTPWQWPTLWDQNKDVPIPNPNLIYPGQRIRLIPRQPEAPKAVDKAPQPPPAPPAPLQEEYVSPSPPVPPPVLPKSPKAAYYMYSPINQVGFVRKEPVIAEGVIVNLKGSKNVISQDDLVYVKESKKDAPLIVGKRYTIYRNREPISDGKKVIGIQHLLLGVLEITSREQEFAIAKVVESYRPISLNDLIMPNERRSPRIPLSDGAKNLDGKILCSEEGILLMGETTVAFIDKGAQDGVAVGQQYFVYEPVKVRTDSSAISLRDIGSLIVLHTEQNNSTVVFSKSERDIYAGNRFHSAAQ